MQSLEDQSFSCWGIRSCGQIAGSEVGGVLRAEQYLTRQNQGRGSHYRGVFLAKDFGSVLQVHRRSERGDSTVGRRISRREIETRRESSRELSYEK